MQTTLPDDATPVTHRARTLTVLRNAGLMVIGKGGIYLAGLLTARLLVELGGIEAYGLWAPCAQALMWVGVLDLGLGLGIQNLASHARTATDRRLVAEAAGAAFAVFATVAVLLAVGGLLLDIFYWHLLLFPFPADLSPALHRDGARVVLIAMFGLAAGLTSQIPFRLVAGVQGHGALATIQGAVALAAVPAIPCAHWVGLHWSYGLMVAVILPLLVPLVAGLRRLAHPTLRWALPRWHGLAPLRTLVAASAAIFVSQIAAIVVFQTNVIVIGRLGGVHEAALLDACMRVLTVPLMAQGIALSAVWPALAQAHAQGDHLWVERAYRRGVGLTLGLMVLAIILALATPAGTGWLLGPEGPRPGPVLVSGLLCFMVFSLWGGLHAQCLNALGLVRGGAALAVLQAAINVPAIIIVYRWGGLDFVPWASAGASLMTAVPGLAWLWWRRPIPRRATVP